MYTIDQKIDDIILKYGIDRYYPLFREIRGKNSETKSQSYVNLVSWQQGYCHDIDGFQNNRSLMERSDLTVMEVNRLLICLNKEINPEQRKEYLQRLFFLSIYKRDFLLAEEMVQYLLNGFSGMEEYRKSWNEINHLVESVKKQVKNRKSRDIVWIWLDAVSFSDRDEIPYLIERSQEDHTISFGHAYTMTPNTNPTFTLILTGQRRIDESSYLIEKINRNNSEVIALLEDTGHICKFVGSYWKQIDDSYKSKAGHYIFAPCSEMLWDMVCNLLEKESKTFIMVHIFPELHTPYFSMNLRQESDNAEEMRRLRGRQEVDRQLRYYMDFIGQEAVQIFFSDHGDNFASKNVFHTVLEVHHKNYKKEKIDEIFSYASFPKLLNQIIAASTINKELFVSDYAEIQEIPIYDKNLVHTIIADRWWLHSNQIWGYHGIIDHKYIYLCHKKSDGNTEESLIKNDSEKHDSFCNLFFPGYHTVINKKDIFQYRAMAGSKECLDEEKLKYSRYLQRVAQNAMPNHERKLQLICTLFRTLPDHGIAFRGGGLDTGRILYFYKQELRGVEFIVDKDKSCMCAELEIPIISPEDIFQKPINTVVLASKKFAEVFRKEAALYPHYINVIDVYQYLADNGIVEKASFYYFQPQDKDYDVGFPFEDNI